MINITLNDTRVYMNRHYQKIAQIINNYLLYMYSCGINFLHQLLINFYKIEVFFARLNSFHIHKGHTYLVHMFIIPLRQNKTGIYISIGYILIEDNTLVHHYFTTSHIHSKTHTYNHSYELNKQLNKIIIRMSNAETDQCHV